MIDLLLKGLQSEAGGQLNNIPGVKSNQLDDIFKIAGNIVGDESSSQMKGGNKDTLMNLFSGNQNSGSANGIQNSMNDKIISELAEKLGMDKTVAKGVAAVVLPAVLNKVAGENGKTPDTDSSLLEGLFGGGGKGNDIGGVLNKLF